MGRRWQLTSLPLIATPDIGAVAAQRLLKLDFTGKSALELLARAITRSAK